MIITGSIITAIVVLLVISLILFYNGMVRGRNMVEEAWSGISVQLKRRHDLVPVLVNSVKGYMTHEQETLTRIAELRASAVSASSSGSVQAIAHAENQLMGALRSLFAVSENYPDLRANENFMQLQEQLSLLEDEIQLSRRYYNGTARDQNNRVLQFPGNLVAHAFGFNKIDYFELADPAEAAVPEVKF
ncbi:LemA family protein [Desulfovibrio sp. SGI.133]|uniref:LemA family protein n=1 Tax=Desulfovibrio sp. SGI.133 TaxID=3420560 RepID=UPI003D055139